MPASSRHTAHPTGPLELTKDMQLLQLLRLGAYVRAVTIALVAFQNHVLKSIINFLSLLVLVPSNRIRGLMR